MMGTCTHEEVLVIDPMMDLPSPVSGALAVQGFKTFPS